VPIADVEAALSQALSMHHPTGVSLQRDAQGITVSIARGSEAVQLLIPAASLPAVASAGGSQLEDAAVEKATLYEPPASGVQSSAEAPSAVGLCPEGQMKQMEHVQVQVPAAAVPAPLEAQPASATAEGPAQELRDAVDRLIPEAAGITSEADQPTVPDIDDGEVTAALPPGTSLSRPFAPVLAGLAMNYNASAGDVTAGSALVDSSPGGVQQSAEDGKALDAHTAMREQLESLKQLVQRLERELEGQTARLVTLEGLSAPLLQSGVIHGAGERTSLG
jgi:hypothetical protein